MKYRLAFTTKNPLPTVEIGSSSDTWIPLDVESLQALERIGARTLLPSVFYDKESHNQIAFEIYHALLSAFRECDELLLQVGESRYLNLVAVFFHEVLRIFCVYYFKRSELDYIFSHYDLDVPDTDTDTWAGSIYVGYDFVINPTVPETLQARVHTDYRYHPKQMARDFLSQLAQLPAILSRRPVRSLLYTRNVAADIRAIAQSLDGCSNGGQWHMQLLSPNQPRIVLPKFEAQLRILKDHLVVLAEKLGSVSWEYPDALNDLLRLVELWIRAHLVDHYSHYLQADVVLTGSLVQLEARLIAARAKSEGVSVISVFHGESCGVHDEPVFGYGENSFADIIIGYGQTGCELATKGEFSGPLYANHISYVPSSSDKAHDLHTGHTIPALSELESPRFMYVPTMFSGDHRYGPYRDLHDLAYLEWQRSLMACLEQSFPGQVIWKGHPKSKVEEVRLSAPGVQELSEQRFEEVMGMADVFIFDYISSAFSLAAATSKPIIYLDIGLRNLSAPALEAIQERCIYVRVDVRQPYDAVRQAIELADERCVNRYTSAFCLAPDVRPRHEVIAETICRLAQTVEVGHSLSS